MRVLPAVNDPRVLVGTTTSDDAAVYQITDNLAMVASVDYITPVVDDAFSWGAIAAANALSDIYAMGARPLFALNLVNFPRDLLPMEVLARVLEGGAAKATEAGISILGGHSIDDQEPKYGMVVIGQVHPSRAICNVGARPGDALLLTKPLGLGMITTAHKRGRASLPAVERAIQVMATLNRSAGESIAECSGVHAATDVTGFGLLGHLSEMLGHGNVGAQISLATIPLIAEAREYATEGMVAGGTWRNLAQVHPLMRWGQLDNEAERLLLADAQTSGGLLIAVDPVDADGLLARLQERGVASAARIGWFNDDAGRITADR